MKKSLAALVWILAEFFKNLVADVGFRMMDCVGGLNRRRAVVGCYGFLWKDGKHAKPGQMRKFQELRAPMWMHMVRDSIWLRRTSVRRCENKFAARKNYG